MLVYQRVFRMYFRGSSSQVCNLYSGLQPGCVFAKEIHDTKCCWLRAYHLHLSSMTRWFIFTLEKLGEDFEQIFSDGLKVENHEPRWDEWLNFTYWIHGEILGLRNHPLILTHLEDPSTFRVFKVRFSPKRIGKTWDIQGGCRRPRSPKKGISFVWNIWGNSLVN